ncbi:MAG: PEP-CTERM sorting domain-containing protein [Sphingomonas sp.]
MSSSTGGASGGGPYPSPTPIPEPESLVMLGTGLVALTIAKRWRRKG